MNFLRAHRIVIDFDRQLIVVNERPEPIGQSTAALKLDNSWISEMLLGACVDRETNSAHLESAQKRQKSSYDATAHGSTYRLGDYVWLRRPRPPPGQTAAFHNPWKGPYVIVHSMSPQMYVIRLLQNPGSEALTVHYNQLKPANEANPTNPCLLPVPPSVPIVEETVKVPSEGGIGVPERSRGSEDSAFVGGELCNGIESNM
ncbi:hypothetical protein FGIG_03706 [Fasciola gigantica]|uniref:Uncharacterized protein n=1 Tax=Fasciola gigantica TaxID=46835 RepID=A0A504Z3C0_FASGI|nr:hypothetical protein FGIG_03706 [Fasciola gigantica]